MALTPMSRDSMLNLKAMKDEEARLSSVGKLVTAIYTCAISLAKTSTTTSLQYPLQLTSSPHQQLDLLRIRNHRQQQPQHPHHITQNYIQGIQPEFYRTNMPDILSSLQELFPGCSVTHTNLTMGQDGNMYDISKLDDSIKPFINQQASKEYIVIDWS